MVCHYFTGMYKTILRFDKSLWGLYNSTQRKTQHQTQSKFVLFHQLKTIFTTYVPLFGVCLEDYHGTMENFLVQPEMNTMFSSRHVW
jgi:hypothetical protein